jgi:hypothetical protein
MTQCARRARDSDGIGAGLRALLLPAAASAAVAPSPTAIASSTSTRWQQECQKEQSEHRSWQRSPCTLSSCQQCKSRQGQR